MWDRGSEIRAIVDTLFSLVLKNNNFLLSGVLMAGVFQTVDELVGAVSKETGVKPDDIRKVLRASFESTKAYIVREAREIEAQQARLRDKIIGSVQV
jgi:hypothetical protein